MAVAVILVRSTSSDWDFQVAHFPYNISAVCADLQRPVLRIKPQAWRVDSVSLQVSDTDLRFFSRSRARYNALSLVVPRKAVVGLPTPVHDWPLRRQSSFLSVCTVWHREKSIILQVVNGGRLHLTHTSLCREVCVLEHRLPDRKRTRSLRLCRASVHRHV